MIGRVRLNFCVTCGRTEGLEHHHLVPRVRGGSDDETNLFTLCDSCHGKIHGEDWYDLRRLRAERITRAKKDGVYGNRDQLQKALDLLGKGATVSEVIMFTGINRKNVNRIRKDPDRALAVLERLQKDDQKRLQKEGIAHARNNGALYLGRRPEYTKDQLQLAIELLGNGKTISEISRLSGISRQTIYQVQKDPNRALAVLELWTNRNGKR
jgi:hypothetical protein